jgi:uracil-DNA glycosylase family 4
VQIEQSNTLSTVFTTDCQRCPRLVHYLAATRQQHPEYYSRPVPSFGPPDARLLLVGLAPGLHGANATGRPFTGDFAGRLLYSTLHRFGMANGPVSLAADDGLTLTGCRITNAVRCVPPQNKPAPLEVRNCNDYLVAELHSQQPPSVVLALGAIAHTAVLRARGSRPAAFPFGHGRIHDLGRGMTLVDSYHCSRYNTQTGRLTPAMFDAVFTVVTGLLGAPR